MATALPAPRPVIVQQMRACGAHDTSARLGAARGPDPGHPRHRRPAARSRQRAPDRLPARGRAAAARGHRPHVLVGAARALRRARSASTPWRRSEAARSACADVGAAGVEPALDLEDVVGLRGDFGLFDHQLQRRVGFQPGVDRIPVVRLGRVLGRLADDQVVVVAFVDEPAELAAGGRQAVLRRPAPGRRCTGRSCRGWRRRSRTGRRRSRPSRRSRSAPSCWLRANV